MLPIVDGVAALTGLLVPKTGRERPRADWPAGIINAPFCDPQMSCALTDAGLLSDTPQAAVIQSFFAMLSGLHALTGKGSCERVIRV